MKEILLHSVKTQRCLILNLLLFLISLYMFSEIEPSMMRVFGSLYFEHFIAMPIFAILLMNQSVVYEICHIDMVQIRQNGLYQIFQESYRGDIYLIALYGIFNSSLLLIGWLIMGGFSVADYIFTIFRFFLWATFFTNIKYQLQYIWKESKIVPQATIMILVVFRVIANYLPVFDTTIYYSLASNAAVLILTVLTAILVHLEYKREELYL